MKVLVSSCLLGNNCKYNGKNNYCLELVEFLKNDQVIGVCPEQLGGLPTPRMPSEIKNKSVIRQDGKDVSAEFMQGAKKSLDIAMNNACKIAILKKKSPSCGFGEIYDGTFTSTVIKGNGVTADLLYKNGIVVLNEENYKEFLKRE